jgi:hypothetical protein
MVSKRVNKAKTESFLCETLKGKMGKALGKTDCLEIKKEGGVCGVKSEMNLLLERMKDDHKARRTKMLAKLLLMMGCDWDHVDQKAKLEGKGVH